MLSNCLFTYKYNILDSTQYQVLLLCCSERFKIYVVYSEVQYIAIMVSFTLIVDSRHQKEKVQVKVRLRVSGESRRGRQSENLEAKPNGVWWVVQKNIEDHCPKPTTSKLRIIEFVVHFKKNSRAFVTSGSKNYFYSTLIGLTCFELH